jgi:restriction system protein
MSLDEIDALSPTAFEYFVAGLLRRDGCLDAHQVGGPGDLGADVLATTPSGLRVVVQCKRYRPGNKVGNPDVQRFNGTAVPEHRADIPILVTTSHFTNDAADWGRSKGLLLVDRKGLRGWTHNEWSPAR